MAEPGGDSQVILDIQQGQQARIREFGDNAQGWVEVPYRETYHAGYYSWSSPSHSAQVTDLEYPSRVE